jgi:hypothetical protein
MGNMILPGTYIQVRPEGLIAPGQVTVGNLGVVGTAAKGTPGVPVLLSSYTDAVQAFYNFDSWVDGKSNELTLVRALQLAFNFGANTVYAVRVAGGSKATATTTLKSTTGECVLLSANSEGTWGNDIGVNIATADDNPQISGETHVGSEPAPLSLKRIPIIKSARNRVTLHVDATNVTKTLQILYGGGLPDDDAAAPLAGQVKINRTTGALAFGDAVLPADKVTATYLVDKAKAVKVTITLGQLKETYTVIDGQNLIDEISDPDTGSKWVTATKKANVTETPLVSNPPDSFANLRGGDNGAAAADYQSGLDAILNEEAHIIVAAGQDDSFGGKLDQHCQKASTDEVKHDRIAVVGCKLSATVDDLQGHNLDSDRVIFVAPGMSATDIDGNEVTLPGAYTAAAVAGLLASLPPHVSPTNKSLSVDDLQTYFNNAQLEVLVESRILAVERRSGFRIVKGITTTTGGAFAQITTRRIVDYAKFGVRLAADPFIGLLNNERVRTALRGSINAFLTQMVKDEMLIDFDLSVSATRDEQLQGIASVTMTLQPVFSIDYIKVTMFLQ